MPTYIAATDTYTYNLNAYAHSFCISKNEFKKNTNKQIEK